VGELLTQILSIAIVPISIAIIALLANILVKRLEVSATLHNKEIFNQNKEILASIAELKSDNALIKEDNTYLKSSVDKIMMHYNIDMENGGYIASLIDYKDYLLSGILENNKREVATIRANNFIDAVSNVITRYQLGMKNFQYIKNEMDGAFHKAMTNLRQNAKNSVNYEEHEKHYREFISKCENILVTSQNGYKEKFIGACNEYMKVFLGL